MEHELFQFRKTCVLNGRIFANIRPDKKVTPRLYSPLHPLQLRSLRFIYTPRSAKAEAKENLYGSFFFGQRQQYFIVCNILFQSSSSFYVFYYCVTFHSKELCPQTCAGISFFLRYFLSLRGKEPCMCGVVCVYFPRKWNLALSCGLNICTYFTTDMNPPLQNKGKLTKEENGMAACLICVLASANVDCFFSGRCSSSITWTVQFIMCWQIPRSIGLKATGSAPTAHGGGLSIATKKKQK